MLWLALSGHAEKYDRCTSDLLHVGVAENSNPPMKAIAANGRNLVHHSVAAFVQPVSGRRRKRNSEQRRRSLVCSQSADGNRRSLVETVVLKNHHGPGFSGVVAAAGCYPEFTAVHSSSNSEIESMKAWSSSAWVLAAMARDCLRASSAKPGLRVSATHICTGRRPCWRSRARCRRTFSTAVFRGDGMAHVLSRLHET